MLIVDIDKTSGFEQQNANELYAELSALEQEINIINKNIEGYERVIGGGKGPVYGFGGEVDYDQLYADDERKRERILARILEIKQKLGLSE
jgi:hypothetical protein